MNNVILGPVYKLRYNHKNRVVTVLEDKGDKVLVWDFVAEDYRTLFRHSIFDIENVTHKCVITDDVNRSFGPDVRTLETDNCLYAVRI